MNKTHLRLSSLAAISMALATGNAIAQDEDFFVRDKYEAVTDRGQSEYDPEAIRSGSWLIRPELGLTAGATSNLFATGQNEVDDFFINAVPSVSINSDWGRNSLGVRGSIDHIEYGDTSSESRTNYSLGADGSVEASSSLSFFGSLQADDLTEPRSNIASLQNANEPVNYTRVGGEAGAQYQSGRLRVGGSVGVQSYDYDDVSVTVGGLPVSQDQDFRDRDEITSRVRVSYAVERDWALFGEIIHGESEYDQQGTVSRDSSSTTFRAGSDFELQSLLRGVIGVGVFNSDFDDPSIGEVEGFSVDGNLQWFVTQLTTVSFGAGREVIDPGLIQTAAAIRTSGSVRADHELRRNLLISGEARYTEFEFENINRADDRWDLRAGATWKVNRNVWVNGSYQLTDQSSNVQDFTDNRLLIGLRIFP